MRILHPYRTALVLAALVGGWHFLGRSSCCSIGPSIDFLFWIHFIKPVYVVEPFEIARSLLLIGVTAAVGAAVGYCFALIWNRIHG